MSVRPHKDSNYNMVDVRTIKAGDTSDTCFKVMNQCTARGLGRSTITNLETMYNFEVRFDKYEGILW
jgi:hypothetical protein